MSDPLDPDFVDVVLDRDVAPCGAAFSGIFSWSDERQMRGARVVLRYETEGRGDTNREDVTVADFPAAKSGQHRFQLRVPQNGPTSYVGDLITLRWEVRGQLDLAGRRDPHATVPVEVVPRGTAPLADGRG